MLAYSQFECVSAQARLCMYNHAVNESSIFDCNITHVSTVSSPLPASLPSLSCRPRHSPPAHRRTPSTPPAPSPPPDGRSSQHRAAASLPASRAARREERRARRGPCDCGARRRGARQDTPPQPPTHIILRAASSPTATSVQEPVPTARAPRAAPAVSLRPETKAHAIAQTRAQTCTRARRGQPS